MWFNDSKSRKGKRKRGRRKTRPFFLRVNAGTENRRVFRIRAVKAMIVLFGLIVAVLLLKTGTQFIARSLLSRNEIFRIRKHDIRCYGDVVKPERVMEYASLNEYANLFEVDIAAVRERLLATVPRIKTVEISRLLNGILAIEVRERVPVARLCMEGYFLTIDEEGYVLGPSARVRELPVISGHYMPGLRPGVFLGDTRIMNALEVLDVCESTPIGHAIRVAGIDLADGNALELRLADGAVVLLAWRDMSEYSAASRRHLERKLIKLADNIREAAVRGERIVEIDMTVEKNFPAKTVLME